jgi:N-methylhydantoinase B
VKNEIIANAFTMITEEMGVTVVRASFSSLIQELLEASAAIFDAQGRLVSCGRETAPMHSSSLRCGLASIIHDFPLESMSEGDVYVMNDPFRGGIHSNDLLVLRPVLARARPILFAGALVHVADLGGVSAGGLPASATDSFSEGLQLPPVALCSAGHENEAIVRILAQNSRMPRQLLGDVRALIGGVTVGCQRMHELLDRFGTDVILQAIDEQLRHSETSMARAISAIPSGRYEGEAFIDDDGTGDGKAYVVRVALAVKDGAVDVDFTGTSLQAAGMINAAYSQSLAATIFGLRACVGLNLPLDEGTYRPVTVNLPFGSLVNPRSPAACNGRVVTCAAIIEAIMRAMAQAKSEFAMAGSGIIHVYTISGVDERGRHWGYLAVEGGGSGARFGRDGASAMSASMFGGGRNTQDMEPLEARYPVLIERSRLLPDSGGPGQWRGGLGTETIIRALRPAMITVRSDRIRFPPPGLAGGEAGRPGSYLIRKANGSVRKLPGKAMNIPLDAGDALVMRSSGGGGVGPPTQRSRERLLEDLQTRMITRRALAADYGVGSDIE